MAVCINQAHSTSERIYMLYMQAATPPRLLTLTLTLTLTLPWP